MEDDRWKRNQYEISSICILKYKSPSLGYFLACLQKTSTFVVPPA